MQIIDCGDFIVNDFKPGITTRLNSVSTIKRPPPDLITIIKKCLIFGLKIAIYEKISILVLEGCTPIAPIGAMEIMNKANVIHQQLTAKAVNT